MAETARMLFACGGVDHDDVVVWGGAFAMRRPTYPFGKVPCLHVGQTATVAQSGSIARFAAKRAGAYPADPLECARADAVFELAQELCTINPLINCYVGSEHERVKRWYLERLPEAVAQLDAQFASDGGPFFFGDAPTHADFNVLHHLLNVRELVDDYDFGDALNEWIDEMERIPRLQKYLADRPTLVGIGTDPGLVDRNGRLVTQRRPYDALCTIRDGLFHFDDAAALDALPGRQVLSH